jgi:hypothetical protein
VLWVAATTGQVLPISLQVAKAVLLTVGVDHHRVHQQLHHQEASIQMPTVILQPVDKKDHTVEGTAEVEVVALLRPEVLVMGNGETVSMYLALRISRRSGSCLVCQTTLR